MESTRRGALGFVAGVVGLTPITTHSRPGAGARPSPSEGCQDAASAQFIQAGPRSAVRAIASKLGDIVSVADKGSTNDRATIQAALDDVRASGRGGSIIFPSAAYTLSGPAVIKGDLHGGITLEGMHASIVSSHDGPALLFGDIKEPGPEYRLHLCVKGLNLSGPGRALPNSVGIAINDAADIYVQGGIVANYRYGLKSSGGLICDFYDLTLRDSGYGFHLSETATFAPNSMAFYGLRAINNDRGGYTNANPNGVINFFSGEIEGNNRGGSDTDGVRITEHGNAGNVNYFGAHFENNPGQCNLYYNGSDSTKNLLIAGCQVIAAAARQVHIERGRATLIASRITSGGKVGAYFGAAASGTLIDVEGDINGALSAVLCVRAGRLGFGINPTLGDPCINVQSSNIVAAQGIAANFRGDAVQIRYQRANGTRAGYFQTSAAGDHVLLNDNRAGGLGFGGHGTILLQVGRGGNNAIEPGRDNAVANGSGSLRWSTIYSATGTIATSDANAKEQIRELNAAERAAALRCKGLIRAYKFKDSVSEKREGARWHFGVIAQDIDHAFAQEGLDARDYGLFCHDSWEGQPANLDDQGTTVRPARVAGERYGIRYEELLAFIIGAL